jgi:dolichol-phosphate mannosyltransferase
MNISEQSADAGQTGRITPALSVVIPVHNESTNIESLITEVGAALVGNIEFELIVVDDYSSDNTREVLDAALKSRPWLRVLHHQGNAGQSTAILTGVRAAGAAWVATLDGDGQNDPADIPALLEMHRERPDLGMICGHRHKRRDTALRRWSSRIANAVRSNMLGDNTPDTGCGLKLFSAEIFLSMPHFDHFHRFMPALFRLRGAGIASVPVNHRERGGGVSHYGVWNRLWVGIVDIIGVMWLKRRAKVVAVDEVVREN